MNSDYLIERRKLKSALLSWRFAALIFFLLCLYAFYGNKVGSKSNIPDNDFIARIRIYGPIFEDDDRLDALKDLEGRDNIKAIVLHIDSPGGTFVGSESLYMALRKLAVKKPLTTVIGCMAASGGYMVALASDHIVAYNGSITGSIGVILESYEVTEILKKLGVQPLSFKSSPFKAMPNLMEKMTPETAKVVQELVDDLQQSFVKIVGERRMEIPQEQRPIICNGRAYSGRQALDYKLIDGIGDEESAIAWLRSNKQISEKLEVKDVLIDDNYSDSQFSFTKNSYYGILSFFVELIQGAANGVVGTGSNSGATLGGTSKALS